MAIDWMNPSGQAVNFSQMGLPTGDTSWYQQQAPRYMAGFASGDPAFKPYGSLYGAPEGIGTEGFWESPSGVSWLMNARAGGQAEQQRQAEADKGGFMDWLGPAALIAGLAFGAPMLFGGFAGAGLEAAAGIGGAAAGATGGGAWYSGIKDFLTSPVSSVTNMFTGGGGGSNAADLAAAGYNPAGTVAGAAAGAGGGVPWGTIANVGAIGTGLLGLNQARDLRQAGTTAAASMDPFGPYRPQAAQQLFALMNNPASVTSQPGFDVGRLALERSLHAQGYGPATTKIPGNYIDAMSTYGGNFYNQEVQRLMTLAGANIPPSGGNLALSGQIGSTQLTGQALQSILAGIAGMARG